MADSPPRAKASDFAPEVLVLFDQYVHGLIDRRAFLNGAARHASAGVSALGLLTALSPDFAYAQKVAPADPRITASRVQIESPLGYGKIKDRKSTRLNSSH